MEFPRHGRFLFVMVIIAIGILLSIGASQLS
jgi:hypothetical protein